MQIKILPKSVAEKIAAGEVVERPASVVKELCENSIDAEAGRITVEIKDGGISYIRVTDDGCGMDGDDAKIAFRRHATSKIASVDDLDYIRTMGFRGEALYAIAAISEIELKSKMAHNEKGTILNVKAGEIIDAFEGDLPGGTTIIVKNLFYNTPARMKFLKSNKTESAYIEELLEKLAMSHPDISFTFITDGKQKFTTNGNGDLLQVIYSIYGNDVAKNVQKIEYEYEGVRVRGVIGNRETHRSNRNFQSVFVNRRFVKCPMVGKAVEEAHKTHIMVGRHPFFVIDIEVEPSLMDINVHPAKTQVKFANEQVIYKAVYWA
ncbi:MAG: DNA mismatch repair endonuclease MutL, partial [Oscillospiraceae bacterium]|nr:DNA mismatch repair endonuclease MutL [Oscillospiraceae bacterium]